MFKKILLLLCGFKLGVSAQISLSSDSVVATENYIKLNYENDFFTATDRYYTQGLQLLVVHSVFRKSPLYKLLPSVKQASSNYYGILLEQNCFTPRSIRHEGIFYNERPYTGTILLAHQRTSFKVNKQLALKTELVVGGIGKCARCEEEQKAIHRALNNIQPLGWENQLNNAFILNYNFTLQKGMLRLKHLQMIAQGAFKGGTLYTNASVGMFFRVGLFTNYFENLGLQKKYLSSKTSKYRAFFLLSANARGVGYNAALQGGVFSKPNVYVLNAPQVTRLVYDASAIVVLAYKHFSIEYGYFYITKEFEQGLDHGWGKCTIVVGF